MKPKNPAAVSLGRKGGKAKTPAQDEARAANLAKGRDKRWPGSVAKTAPIHPARLCVHGTMPQLCKYRQCRKT